MHNLDLSEWAAVIIVSGDGLIYEVYQYIALLMYEVHTTTLCY